MTLRCWLLSISTLLGLVPLIATQANSAPLFTVVNNSSCPKPALSRLIHHKVAPGETLESIAQQYNLISATLMGMNPTLQKGKVVVGNEILIPPFNGIRVKVPRGQTWVQVAAIYNIRADVLFEVNGCQTAPTIVFVPGVNWSPNPRTVPEKLTISFTSGSRGELPKRSPGIFKEYPLPTTADIALGYGWQIHPDTGKVFFHSGLDLSAAAGTSVRAVAAGTVEFAGKQASYGNLVVVNHQDRRQSRYAQLKSVAVRAGQTIKQGDLLGIVGATGKPSSKQPHLHFEVRSASSLGWVAEDPSLYLQQEKATREVIKPQN